MNSLPKNIIHPIIMFRDQSCDVRSVDGKYIFVAESITGENINNNPAKVQEFLAHFPRLNHKELLGAGDGVYTWLIYSEPDSDEKKFICTEVVSPYELGTRHQALAHNSRYKIDRIYGGGELIKEGLNIHYNLLSGTYSKPIIQFNYGKTKRAAIEKAFLSFFPEAERHSDEYGFISKVILIKPEILDLYKKYGYIVFYFKTRNECVKFNNSFGHFDWQIDYFKKLINSDAEKDKIIIHKQLLENALENMLKLLEDKMAEDKKNVGGHRKNRKTRRQQR